MAGALRGYWYCLARYGEGRYWLDRALTQADDQGIARVRALWLAGHLLSMQDAYDQALPYFDQARELAEPIEDDHGLACTISFRGVAAMLAGHHELCLQLMGDALTRFEKLGDEPEAAIAHFYMSYPSLCLGQIPEAIAHSDASLAVFTNAGEICYQAFALVSCARNGGS